MIATRVPSEGPRAAATGPSAATAAAEWIGVPGEVSDGSNFTVEGRSR